MALSLQSFPAPRSFPMDWFFSSSGQSIEASTEVGPKPKLSSRDYVTKEEGKGKLLQYSCLESPMNSMKRQNDRILKEELPRSVGAPCGTGDQWRNNSRKNEGMETKQKQHPAVDVTGDRSKIR